MDALSNKTIGQNVNVTTIVGTERKDVSSEHLNAPSINRLFNRLPDVLIQQIISFMSGHTVFCLDRRMRQLSSNPLTEIIVARNFLANCNPAIARWIESLKLPATNWLEIRRLVQQPNFLSPTRKYNNLGTMILCPLRDGCLAYILPKVVRSEDVSLCILNPKTAAVEFRTNIAKKITLPLDGYLSAGYMRSLSNSRLALSFTMERLSRTVKSLIIIYDLKDDKVVKIYSSASDNICSFEEIEDCLVLGLMHSIEIRDIQTGRLLRTISDQQAKVNYSLVGLANGLFAGASKGDIHIWDLKTGLLQRILKNKTDRGTKLYATSNGNLVSLCSNALHVWNPETGDQVGSIKLPDVDYGTLKVLPHDLFVFTDDRNNDVHIARITTGEPLFSLKGTAQVAKLEVWPDGRIITQGFNSIFTISDSFQYDHIANLITAANQPLKNKL